MGNIYFGLGYDVHRVAALQRVPKGAVLQRPLILAGVEVPAPFSLRAVSDGDVVLHAVCDALCGAAGLGDIGDYFPPQDTASRGLDSKDIATVILKKITRRFLLVNLDITIIAQKPRLVGYKARMLESLRKVFPSCQINVKIKSKEGLDIFGGRNAIACLAAACLQMKSG
ncbi:MAG: 2-C-methyl-D-erythritol 2,4-cyclodiphosphate synthase [Candidatus Omnitrophota bacterium]|nr:2-C-methyl-D-erythritol 2,4-cyclodiphosphate synthase [Candidatus Omnitrophota bacterium]